MSYTNYVLMSCEYIKSILMSSIEGNVILMSYIEEVVLMSFTLGILQKEYIASSISSFIERTLK